MNVARHTKYRKHRRRAKKRDIPWEITYPQWSLIWARSGHWHERGRKRGQYVMARFGDRGPYAPGNVKIILSSENISEGSLGLKRSAQTRALISAAGRGRKHSPETRAKMMGNKNALGYKHSTEARAKISATHKGHKVSVKTRAQISAAMMGNKNHLGRKHTTELRDKMRQSHLKRYKLDLCYENSSEHKQGGI